MNYENSQFAIYALSNLLANYIDKYNSLKKLQKESTNLKQNLDQKSRTRLGRYAIFKQLYRTIALTP